MSALSLLVRHYGFELVRAPSSVSLGRGSAIVAKGDGFFVWIHVYRAGPKYGRYTAQRFSVSRDPKLLTSDRFEDLRRRSPFGRDVPLPDTCQSRLRKVLAYLRLLRFRRAAHKTLTRKDQP